MSEATDDGARERWAARRRLVKQQTKALDSVDRAELIAQQQAWVREAQALTDLPRAITGGAEEVAAIPRPRGPRGSPRTRSWPRIPPWCRAPGMICASTTRPTPG